jgi:cell division protein FtsL
MKKSLRNYLPVFLIICLFVSGIPSLQAQYVMPAILDTATMDSQLEYIQERTRIYNDFRAIREDIFQKTKGNFLDSLNAAKLEIATLNSRLAEISFQIESLNSDLEKTKNDRDEAIRNRDSLSFLGIQLNKTIYNTIMWLIILGLVVVAVVVFLMYKRSRIVTVQSKKEFEEIREEFENYRKSSREKYEKLVVSHHNEIMRLKRS